MTNLLGRRARGSYHSHYDPNVDRWVFSAVEGEVVAVFCPARSDEFVWILDEHGVIRRCSIRDVVILPILPPDLPRPTDPSGRL